MAVSKKKTSDMNASSEKNPSEKALSREVIFETLTDMLSELLVMKKSDFSENFRREEKVGNFRVFPEGRKKYPSFRRV